MPPAWKILIGLNTFAAIVVIVAIPYLYNENKERARDLRHEISRRVTEEVSRSPCTTGHQAACRKLLDRLASGHVIPLSLACEIATIAGTARAQNCDVRVRVPGSGSTQDRRGGHSGTSTAGGGRTREDVPRTQQPSTPAPTHGTQPQPSAPGQPPSSPPAILDTCIDNPLLKVCLNLRQRHR